MRLLRPAWCKKAKKSYRGKYENFALRTDGRSWLHRTRQRLGRFQQAPTPKYFVNILSFHEKLIINSYFSLTLRYPGILWSTVKFFGSHSKFSDRKNKISVPPVPSPSPWHYLSPICWIDPNHTAVTSFVKRAPHSTLRNESTEYEWKSTKLTTPQNRQTLTDF